MEYLNRYLKNLSGVAATEFALIAPIFLVLVLGTVDMGLYIAEQMRLQNVAYSVANYVRESTSDNNASVVAAEVYDGRGDINLTTAFECQCSDGVVGECPLTCDADDYQRRFISVNVSGTFSSLFPYPGLPESLDLDSTVRMRVD